MSTTDKKVSRHNSDKRYHLVLPANLYINTKLYILKLPIQRYNLQFKLLDSTDAGKFEIDSIFKFAIFTKSDAILAKNILNSNMKLNFFDRFNASGTGIY